MRFTRWLRNRLKDNLYRSTTYSCKLIATDNSFQRISDWYLYTPAISLYLGIQIQYPSKQINKRNVLMPFVFPKKNAFGALIAAHYFFLSLFPLTAQTPLA